MVETLGVWVAKLGEPAVGNLPRNLQYLSFALNYSVAPTCNFFPKTEF